MGGLALDLSKPRRGSAGRLVSRLSEYSSFLYPAMVLVQHLAGLAHLSFEERPE